MGSFLSSNNIFSCWEIPRETQRIVKLRRSPGASEDRQRIGLASEDRDKGTVEYVGKHTEDTLLKWCGGTLVVMDGGLLPSSGLERTLRRRNGSK